MATRKTTADEPAEEIVETTPVAEAPEVDYEEYVEYVAPLTTPDAKPIFVGVNGETIRIQRGVPVRIKRKFYLALMDAQRQEFEAFKAQKAAMEAAQRSMADM